MAIVLNLSCVIRIGLGILLRRSWSMILAHTALVVVFEHLQLHVDRCT